MLRFMVHSSRITGILHRRCARSMEYPLASQNIRHFSDDQQVEEKDTKKISGFAKSYETLKSIADNIDKPIKDTRTFRELFRKSNFVDVSITDSPAVSYIPLTFATEPKYFIYYVHSSWAIHLGKEFKVKFISSSAMIYISILDGNSIVYVRDQTNAHSKQNKNLFCSHLSAINVIVMLLFLLQSEYFSMYVCGAIVELKIEKLELSSRFLGESQDLTLNEADCQLIRLISSPEERASRDMPPAIIYEDPIKDIEDDKIAEKRARPKSHNMKWF